MNPSYDRWTHRSSEKRTEDLREIRGKYLLGTVFHYIYVLPGATWTLPLRGYPRVGKTGSTSLKQVIPNAQYAAGSQGSVGQLRRGLEAQLIIPDATQPVSGQAQGGF